MEELSRQVELQIISYVLQSDSWLRIRREHHKIKKNGVKEEIKNKFDGTDIKKWKKEYAYYLHKRSNLRIEIHRCVNLNNFSQEFDVEIKRPKDSHWIGKIIAVIEEEFSVTLFEVATTRD